MKNSLLIYLLFISHAFAAEPTFSFKLDGVVDLPIKALKAIEKNGKIFYVSEKGRYIIQGQLIDVWHKKPLDTLKEIKYSAEHINIKTIGWPVEKMNVITLGKGRKEVFIFVDPVCDVCKDFINAAEKRTDEYTFKFIVVPALGPNSNILAKNLFCAEDKSNALKLLKNKKLDRLPQAKVNCDIKYYDQTLLLASTLDVKAVPFFISPSGRLKAGFHKDIWQWMTKI